MRNQPLLLPAIFCLVATTLSAATFKVNSLADLETAVSNATSGSTIVLANGVYTSSNAIRITRQGTAKRPITICAESVGGAEITGADGFHLEPPAAWIIIKGFKFTHGVGQEHTLVGGEEIAAGANHCRYTRCTFQLTGRGHYLMISGDDAEIDHNTFQNKFTEGQMIIVHGPGTNQMAQRTWIHHNFFNNFRDTHENNCSAIQIGVSWRSMAAAHALVESNLFLHCHGENENICNKSCENTYRFNTFGEGCSELSLRHGNANIVYANFFLGSEGIRIFGHDDKIFSNYFEKCSRAIHIGNGDGIIPPAKLTAHDRPDHIQVVFNTLVDNRKSLMMLERRRGGLGAKDFTFANNIIVTPGKAVDINGPLTNAFWRGNIIWGCTNDVGNIPESGYRLMDPKLARDAQGEWHLQKGSPAIAAGVGSYPFVTMDIDGQKRRGKLDVGADQFTRGKIINRILTPADVGPEAP
ncbi:MAG TPA: polysaccharide lyase 6 family protein [Candidatus Angelobacter sp.]|nr:polysaccharide lyase 6 family protein [Candidatus Angelobacter sp.]